MQRCNNKSITTTTTCKKTNLELSKCGKVLVLVHPFLAVAGAAEARQPVLVLVVELVVVGELLAAADPPVSKDDDVEVAVDFDDLGDAIGVARVVDVPGHVARHGGVENSVVVKPEHVDAAVLLGVALLPDVCQLGPDDLADVLDDHLVFFEVASCVEAEALDSGPCENNVLSPLLLHFPVLRTLRLDEVLRVGSGRLEADEQRDAFLGGTAEAISGFLVARVTSGHGSLEVVDPLHPGPHQRLGSCAAGRVDGQRKLQEWVPAVLEVVVCQGFDARKRLQDLSRVEIDFRTHRIRLKQQRSVLP